jgi:ABC-type glycerol-3-phosphate transport system substrate-binding protein
MLSPLWFSGTEAVLAMRRRSSASSSPRAGSRTISTSLQMQVTARPLAQEDAIASGDWRYIRIDQEQVWAKAIHRVVTENISPEQAVDEAIARIKQILAE